MIFIVAALYIEAQPLIEYYRLKRDNSDRYYQVFNGENITLVITGTGKINSAAGVSHLLSKCILTTDDVIVNWGICGTSNLDYEIGNAYLVHKVTDNETGRSFYPDILLSHPWEEADMETFSKKVTGKSMLTTKLCDMEGSGFFQAASKYYAPHRIQIIKIVSDRLEGEPLDKNLIKEMLQRNVSQFHDFIIKLPTCVHEGTDVFSQEEYMLMDSIIGELRLSESQKHQLIKACRQYKVRTDKSLEILRKFEGIRVKTKDEGKQQLRQIFGELFA